MLRILLVTLSSLIACSGGGKPAPPLLAPLAPLIPCNPEVCDAPRSCHPIDGVDLCVLTCPAGAPICDPDEFPMTRSGAATCACVPQRPGGRVCSTDADCAWGPDASGTEHLCVSHGGALSCQQLGVACRTGADCGAGFVCDPSRVCTKAPQPPPVVFRRDADSDGLCTSESQSALPPGPGAGWRTDCSAEERAECDDFQKFTCAPTDTDVIGSVLVTGTVHTPMLIFNAENGGGYSFGVFAPDSIAAHLSRYEGGARLRIAVRLLGPDGRGGVAAELHGWWLEGLVGGATPVSGRLRVEGGKYYLYTASEKLHLTATGGTSLDGRLSRYVNWRVWVVGKPEGTDYRIWRSGGLYLPDVP
jgi:hypothetical protein